jgi:23S rRNA pseudouridine2605 synthase
LAKSDEGVEAPVPSDLPSTDPSSVFADVLSGAYDQEPDPAPEPALEAADPLPGELNADQARSEFASAEAASVALPTLDDPQAPVHREPSPGEAATDAATLGMADDAAFGADEESALPHHDAADAAGSPEQPSADARRVLAPEPFAPKLQKVLAQSGIGSRRDLEQMIASGRIMVNGQAAHVGQRVRAGDRVTLDGKPIRLRIAPPVLRVLAYHKPVGEVVTYDDPQARPTVFRRLPRLPQGKWQSVGRLDINTEGLLLFTNQGDLANRLMHPRFGVEREYAVRVLGELQNDERERLMQGVEIDGQAASFRSIEDGGGDGANRWYRVVITEGRNREVRKLFEALGKAVSRLIRIRYGSVVLPRGLRRGMWVDLGPRDLLALRQATGLPQQQQQQRQPKPGARPPRDRASREQGARDQGPRDQGPRDQGPRERGAERRGAKARPPRDKSAARRALETGFGHAVHQNYDAPDQADWDDSHEPSGPIPNPLQQTFDRRALQAGQKPRREYEDDGPIPNPLQQTYDKRALQAEQRKPRREFSEDGPIPNPLQQTYDKRFGQGGKAGGPARGGRRGAGGAKPGGEPDPMRTAVGYIGGDAYLHKLRGGGAGKPGGKPGAKTGGRPGGRPGAKGGPRSGGAGGGGGGTGGRSGRPGGQRGKGGRGR